jgi:hypothetical protein
MIDQIDKFRKQCLWRGADVNVKQRPKLLGLLFAGLRMREA